MAPAALRAQSRLAHRDGDTGVAEARADPPGAVEGGGQHQGVPPRGGPERQRQRVGVGGHTDHADAVPGGLPPHVAGQPVPGCGYGLPRGRRRERPHRGLR
ncbi:MAG: hypothetical protein U5R31_10440 [Acidimicrobiia bacterium]|nr:hypothetical protein [Acidimicrobiia bacterium]